MPIRPENKGRYPANWPEIRSRIAARAGGFCEWCRAPNGRMIRRGIHNGQPVWQETYSYFADVFSATDGALVPGASFDDTDFRPKKVKVILTVAHLDHQPENCDEDNLRHLCQRCHNSHDAKHRAAGRRARKEQQNGLPLLDPLR